MHTDTVSVSIHSRNNRELAQTSGEITRINWDKADRPKNAAKTLIMWLAACFACVFVPIAHFVLVPSLFITAFVLAIDKSREEKRNDGGKGECPKCHQQFVIEKSKWTDRLTDTCGKCHDDLEISIPQT
jgi:ssDNA-binding Zn-finger/Zn-ribbon topoisomerase 1